MRFIVRPKLRSPDDALKAASFEMECAALAAVARFRGVQFGQILYGGDDVSGDTWDARGWGDRIARAGIREKIFWLAVDAVLEL